MNYDPRYFAHSQPRKRTRQIVELTFQQWEFMAVRRVAIESSELSGLHVVILAIETLYDELDQHSEGLPELVLFDGEGNSYSAQDELGAGTDYLQSMLVKSEILSVEPIVTMV